MRYPLPWAAPLAAILLPVPPAAAQDADPGAQPTVLDPVVVTATRYEQGVESVPANVSVIGPADIADSAARDVPTLLGRHAGLHAYDITGNRRSYRVDRSGFGETAGQNTLVLVDGRRVNTPDLSGADWMLIPVERIAGLEVVRGSRGSVLYGDNASDAVVNILTKRGGGPFAAGGELAGGSWSTFSASAYANGSAGDLGYGLTGSWYESDGYRDNSQTRQGDLGLSLGYAFSGRGRLDFSAGWHRDDTGLPGALRQSDLDAGAGRTDSTHPFDYSDTRDAYGLLTPRIDILDDSWLRMPISYRSRDQEFYASFVGGEFRGNTEIDTLILSPQAVVKEPLAGLANTLTVGLDYSDADEDIRNTSSFFGALDIASFTLGKTNYGVYVHDELSPTERLALSAGWRWDRVEYDFSPVAPGTADEADYTENVGTAGLSWRFAERSWVYGSLSQGFRYPALDELFSFFTNTVNGDLRPQTSEDWEIGVRHRFDERGYANLNLFRVETSDEIYFDPGSFANENLDGRTRRDGLEIAAGWDDGPVGLSAAYVYRDTEILGGVYQGNAVPNVPRHQASADLLWRPLEGVTLALNGVYVGERYLESDYDNAFEKQDAYRVLNLKVRYTRSGLTVFMDVNNVLNEKYAAYGVLSTFPVEPAYYPAPEINLFAGVRYDL